MLSLIKNGTGEILQLFFRDPDKEYYLREIGRFLNKEPGVFQRSIRRLVNEGILADRRKANLRYFRLNKQYPLYAEIKQIVSKTLGIEAQLRKLTDSLGGVETAFIFGSMAKNTENSFSDIDLMLIGQVNQDEFMEKINEAENMLGREINYHVFEKNEITRKLKGNNDFLKRIFMEQVIILKGNLNEFEKFN